MTKSSESPCFPVFFRTDRNGPPELPEAGERRAYQADGEDDRDHGRRRRRPERLAQLGAGIIR